MNSTSAGGAGKALAERKVPLELCRLLAGLEAGIVGGAAMLAWVGLAGMFIDRQPFWLVPNLLASVFYGASALHRGFSSDTVSGLALHAVTSAVLGVGFAFLVRDYGRRTRLALVGIMLGLVWYHLSVTLIWRRLGALASLYISPSALLPGHLIFGLLLARYPGTLRSVLKSFGWWSDPPPLAMPAAVEAPPEVPGAE